MKKRYRLHFNTVLKHQQTIWKTNQANYNDFICCWLNKFRWPNLQRFSTEETRLFRYRVTSHRKWSEDETSIPSFFHKISVLWCFYRIIFNWECFSIIFRCWCWSHGFLYVPRDVLSLEIGEEHQWSERISLSKDNDM